MSGPREICSGGEGAADFLARRHDLGWNRRNQVKLEGHPGQLYFLADVDLRRDLETLHEQEGGDGPEPGGPWP